MPSVGALTAAAARWLLALPGGTEGRVASAHGVPGVGQLVHTAPWTCRATPTCFGLSQQSSPEELSQVKSWSHQP